MTMRSFVLPPSRWRGWAGLSWEPWAAKKGTLAVNGGGRGWSRWRTRAAPCARAETANREGLKTGLERE